MEKKKDLCVKVTPLAEDCFFLLMALNGRISRERGKNALRRIEQADIRHIDDAIGIAKKMAENLKEYGIPSSEWP